MDRKKDEGIDIVAGLFNLLDKNPKMTNEQLLALLSLFTLLSIVNLMKPVTIQVPANTQSQGNSGEGNNLVDTLSGLLNNKNLNTGDLAGLVSKNPGAIVTMMNLLSAMKEQRNSSKGEEPKEGKKVLHEEAQSTIIKDKNQER